MTIYDDLYDRFLELHSDIAKAVDGIPVEALDWSPGSDINSIAVLVVHTAAAERFWIGAVVLGEPSNRVRGEEFQTRGKTADDLKQGVADADNYARAALARLGVSDLDAVRISPRNGQSFSIGWCLFHVLEHTALHLGHIQITRQLWEQAH